MRVPIPRLVAALCARLEAGEPALSRGAAGAAAADVLVALRSEADEETLAALLSALDAALRAEGLPHGLGAGEYRASETQYGPFRGLQARGVHAVMRCPAAMRCDRVVRATWAVRATPPICAVYDLPLHEDRLQL